MSDHQHECYVGEPEHSICRCECGATASNSTGESEWSMETKASTGPDLGGMITLHGATQEGGAWSAFTTVEADNDERSKLDALNHHALSDPNGKAVIMTDEDFWKLMARARARLDRERDLVTLREIAKLTEEPEARSQRAILRINQLAYAAIDAARGVTPCSIEVLTPKDNNGLRSYYCRTHDLSFTAAVAVECPRGVRSTPSDEHEGQFMNAVRDDAQLAERLYGEERAARSGLASPNEGGQ